MAIVLYLKQLQQRMSVLGQLNHSLKVCACSCMCNTVIYSALLSILQIPQLTLMQYQPTYQRLPDRFQVANHDRSGGLITDYSQSTLTFNRYYRAGVWVDCCCSVFNITAHIGYYNCYSLLQSSSNQKEIKINTFILSETVRWLSVGHQKPPLKELRQWQNMFTLAQQERIVNIEA